MNLDRFQFAWYHINVHMCLILSVVTAVGAKRSFSPLFSPKQSFFDRHMKLDGGTICTTTGSPMKQIDCNQCCSEGVTCNLGFWCDSIGLIKSWKTPELGDKAPLKPNGRMHGPWLPKIYCFAFSTYPPMVHLMKQMDEACDSWPW